MQHPDPKDVSDPVIDISERRVGIVVDERSPVRLRSRVDDIVEAAFAAHADRLTAFALAAVHDRDVADDMVAETFLRFVREVQAERVPDNIGGWLYRVCANVVTSRGRRVTVARRALSRLLDRTPVDSPETLALRHDRNDRTVRALASLPEDARIALLMAAEGYDMVSIGEAIGRTATATRTFVCRSRVRLRDVLAEDGTDEAGA